MQPAVEPTALNVTPAGRVSTARTPVAATGPLFVTVIVYVNEPVSATGSAESDFVTDRFVRNRYPKSAVRNDWPDWTATASGSLAVVRVAADGSVDSFTSTT